MIPSRTHLITPPMWEIARLISENFPDLVFVGGTALFECYLKHRYSEDIDFASSQLRHTRDIAAPMTAVLKSAGWPSSFLESPVGATTGYVKHPGHENQIKVQIATLPLLQEDAALSCESVRVAAIENLRVMKLDALADFDRDELKDIFDLWTLHGKIGPLLRSALPTTRTAAVVARLQSISARWSNHPPPRPGWYIGSDWESDRAALSKYCADEYSRYAESFLESALRPPR